MNKPVWSFYPTKFSILVLSFVLLNQTLQASTHGYVTVTMPVTSPQEVKECRKVFSASASNTNFWATQHLEFSYDSKYTVTHKNIENKKKLDPKDINNIDYRFLSPVGPIAMEYSPEGKSPDRATYARDYLVKSWIESTLKHKRFRQNLDVESVLASERSLNLHQTSLFYFENVNERMGFRIYDSSTNHKYLFELWPSTKDSESRGYLENKYLQSIPSFKKLVDQYSNIISIGLFSATKGWGNAKEFLYHQAARYIDTNYNSSGHFLLGESKKIKSNDVLVLATAPKRMGNKIHNNLNFELLRDENGKVIYTPDGYEIIYLKGSDLIASYNDGPVIPLLKGETSGENYNKAWQYFRKRTRTEFKSIIEEYTNNPFYLSTIENQSKIISKEVNGIIDKIYKSKSDDEALSHLKKMWPLKADLALAKIIYLKLKNKESGGLSDLLNIYGKEFYELFFYFYMAAAGKNPASKLLVLNHWDTKQTQFRNKTFISESDFVSSYQSLLKKMEDFQRNFHISLLEAASPKEAIEAIELILAGIHLGLMKAESQEEGMKYYEEINELYQERLYQYYQNY